MNAWCYRLGVLVAVLYIVLALAAPGAADRGIGPLGALVAAVLVYDRIGERRRG